jgi:hypothetical protein
LPGSPGSADQRARAGGQGLVLSTFGNTLRLHAESLRDPAVLDEAVVLLRRRAVAACGDESDNHPSRPGRQANLGNALRRRFEAAVAALREAAGDRQARARTRFGAAA